MRKIAIALVPMFLLLLGVRAYLSYWYFIQGVDSFDAIIKSPTLSESMVIKELEAIEQDFGKSNTIKPTTAATKNQAYIAELLRNIRTKSTDVWKDTSKPQNNESPKKDTSGSGSNTGTWVSFPESASGSTLNAPSINEPSIRGGSKEAAGPNAENSWEIRSRIADLKQLQQNKGDFTRPDGTIGTPPEKSLMEQFFGNEPLFGDDWAASDY